MTKLKFIPNNEKNVIPNLFWNLNNFNDNINSLSAFVLISDLIKFNIPYPFALKRRNLHWEIFVKKYFPFSSKTFFAKKI